MIVLDFSVPFHLTINYITKLCCGTPLESPQCIVIRTIRKIDTNVYQIFFIVRNHGIS